MLKNVVIVIVAIGGGSIAPRPRVGLTAWAKVGVPAREIVGIPVTTTTVCGTPWRASVIIVTTPATHATTVGVPSMEIVGIPVSVPNRPGRPAGPVPARSPGRPGQAQIRYSGRQLQGPTVIRRAPRWSAGLWVLHGVPSVSRTLFPN
ncbi:hypothetical protein HOY82DRAFT_631237 [Tuber indicum]|nr:hypothetical protein HOY82DRAFT_631237 [Tuber indicum]